MYFHPILVEHVLLNMLKNAAEASKAGKKVAFWTETSERYFTFKIWNENFIPEEIATHIFQHYFSTKQGDGGGIETYSMKLIGEQYLNGRVWFTSTQKEGATFCFTLPFNTNVQGVDLSRERQ